jgi:hypothetical protein
MSLTDDELYAQIRAAQAVAVEKLQQRWGMTADQVTAARASIAAPTPNTITTADLEAAWARSAQDQFRGLGIQPVSDEEAAKIQAAMDEAVAAHQTARASEMDQQLLDFRAEVAHDRAAKSGLYYNEDAAKMREIERLVRETEIAMIETRLAAGLPAEPAPRKTAVEIALERHNARRAQSS